MGVEGSCRNLFQGKENSKGLPVCRESNPKAPEYEVGMPTTV